MRLRDKLILDYYLGSLLHVILKPLTILLGRLLRRSHDLGSPSEVTVIKLLGGGSLVIAYPSLLALKRAPGLRRLSLLTTPAVKPFAESLGVFDRLIVVRDDSAWHLLVDSLRALRLLFRTEAIVDLEIHSRLTTVFSLLTCARNRVGFYTNSSFWRQRISTHLLFCNLSNGIFESYDQVARLFGGRIPGAGECQRMFRAAIAAPEPPLAGARLDLALAPCCSDLSPERRLQAAEWAAILERRMSLDQGQGREVTLHLLGGPGDRPYLEDLRTVIAARLPGIRVENHGGLIPLAESVRRVAASHELLSIDSALVHYGRLLGVRTVSFWGPTDPRLLLRPLPDAREEIHYRKLSCSPCVHLTQQPPCCGHNLCMRLAADPHLTVDMNPAWVVTGEKTRRFHRFSAP
jgi:ADP-heptose:LPS heptosyltransferase